MKIMVRQIRLHTRPLFSQYLEQAELAWPNGVDYAIALHGKGIVSDRESHLLSRTPWMDYRHRTSGSLTQLLYILCEEFLASDCDILVTLDDDAVFSAPRTAISIMEQIIERFPNVGVFGPLESNLAYYKYKHVNNDTLKDLAGNEFPAIIGEVNEPPWCTYGCQIWTRKALEKIGWRTIFGSIHYWSDYPLFMDAQRKGFQVLEVSFPYYKHRGTLGRKVEGGTPLGCDSKDEMLETLASDKALLAHFFIGADPKYMKAVETFHKHTVDKILNPRGSWSK